MSEVDILKHLVFHNLLSKTQNIQFTTMLKKKKSIKSLHLRSFLHKKLLKQSFDYQNSHLSIFS